MEYRPLDITVISASELKNVNIFMKMDVYVVVYISGGQSCTKRKTHVDRSGGSNPEWNHRIKFTLEETSISKHFLNFQLKAERSLGDKVIGEVALPLGDLFQDSDDHKTNDDLEAEYQVRTTSGRARGTLKFSFKFGEKFTQQIQGFVLTTITTTTASPSSGEIYPPPSEVAVAGAYYPPMTYVMHPQPMMIVGQYPGGFAVPAGYTYPGCGGYPYPPPYLPPPGYGYPAGQPVAYAYMPVKQPMHQPRSVEKKKQSGSGSKLGLGLGAGMLGGFLFDNMELDVEKMLSEDVVAAGGDTAVGVEDIEADSGDMVEAATETAA